MLHEQLGIKKYRFGVNYTPVNSWYYCWNDFDAGAIAKDFDSIAAIGADHMRVMLMWPYFQPNPKQISEAHLARLDKLMTLAGERGLDVCLTLFVGWLSGYAFKPPFQRDDTFYQLEGKLPAHYGMQSPTQELYVKSVATVATRHQNFLGFDLGNELNCCWKAPDLAVGDRWTNHMLALTKECAPNGVHVNGIDHNPWTMEETFSPENLARAHEIVPLHCWIYFAGALARSDDDCLAHRCIRLSEGMAALARAYAGDAAKPIWLQEYGISEKWVTDNAKIPAFLRLATENALKSGINWLTWWCSHDLDEKYAFNPLEYSLGLITTEQKIKESGKIFKELAEAYRGKEVTALKAKDIPAPPTAKRTPESSWEWLDNYFAANPLD